ncbi:MAG: hypothetical protein IJZ75_07295 [Clostridia bacterium]|nr:hypothetical protein [Clostridia bacterium]
MRKLFSKRLIAVVLAVVVCVSAAGASMAVDGSVAATRTITVDTNDVVNECYAGVGNNHWSAPYVQGMNDAYQTVNEKRLNLQKFRYMRMLFVPNWLVDTSLSQEQQEENWNNGIYYYDGIEFKNFMSKVAMYDRIGTTVLLNFGGVVTEDISGWFLHENVSENDAGKGAPKNLEAFAKAIKGVIEYCWNEGYDNVEMLSFYNEVNGGSYRMFFDAREHWAKMIVAVDKELSLHTYTGNPNSVHYNKNIRDEIKMFGTELSGFANNDAAGIQQWCDTVIREAVNENGEPAYDYLNTHHYPMTSSYDSYLDAIDATSARYPGVWANETLGRYAVGNTTHSNEPYALNYKYNALSMVTAQANEGYGGSALWVVGSDSTPAPMSILFSGDWDFPSGDMHATKHVFALNGLLTRYIPFDSKVYKSNIDSADMVGAVFGVEDNNGNIEDMTVMLDVEENSAQRELTVKVGSKMANRTFERHIYYFPEKDSEGWEWPETLYENGADILPVTDKEITADANGNIVDILPNDKHIAVVYTTLDEQVQIVTDTDYVELSSGAKKDFNVTAIYGTDNDSNLSNVTWEVFGKARTDTNGGYSWTTENCGTIDQDGKYDATGTTAGDTVSIKITSKYDPSAYTIIIAEIV